MMTNTVSISKVEHDDVNIDDIDKKLSFIITHSLSVCTTCCIKFLLTRAAEYWCFLRMHRRNQAENSGSLELPDWIFDVDEVDDSPDINILQELDIDVPLVYSVIIWMMFHPWYWFFCSSSITPSPHPLSSPTSQKEFWGPCGVVSKHNCCVVKVNNNYVSGCLVWINTVDM